MGCHDNDRLLSCVRDGRSSALRMVLSLFFLELNFSACTEFADRSFGEASLRTLPHHEPSISSVTRVMGPNSKLLTYKVCRCSSVEGILIYRVCLHKLSSPSGITRVMLSSASLAASYGWCESVSANVRGSCRRVWLRAFRRVPLSALYARGWQTCPLRKFWVSQVSGGMPFSVKVSLRYGVLLAGAGWR